MPLHTNENLKHANKVLALVKKLWLRGLDGTIKVWSNGREQGYFLIMNDPGSVMKDRCLVFSESRGSQEVVVCAGTREDFDAQTNQPKEGAWDMSRGLRYFPTDQDAAEFVTSYLAGHIDLGR